MWLTIHRLAKLTAGIVDLETVARTASNVAGIERERLWVFMFRESDNIAVRSDRKESKYQRIKAEKFRTWDRLS